jgi:hypothetical protein
MSSAGCSRPSLGISRIPSERSSIVLIFLVIYIYMHVYLLVVLENVLAATHYRSDVDHAHNNGDSIDQDT